MILKLALGAFFLLISWFLFAQEVKAQYITHKTLDFENGDLSGWGSPIGNERCCADSIIAQSQIVRAGNYAARTILRDGDVPKGTGERAEMRLNGSNNQDKVPYGQDVWFGFSVYIDPTYDPNGNYNFNILAQWHQSADTGSPLLDLEYIYGGDFYVYIRSTVRSLQTFKIGSGAKGRWHDFIFNIKLSYQEGGGSYVRVWQNGTQVLNYSGPVGYSGDIGPYFKMGVYRSPTYSDTQIVYHDEFRRGTSYAEVDPSRGGTNPSPSPAPACPADITGDREINALDMLRLLGRWGGCSGCREDINGDGQVNSLDVLRLLASWGGC